MRRALLLAGLALAGLALTGLADEKDKGSQVTLDGLKSTTPSGWVKETPSNRMRLAQFKLPKAKGDKEDAELIIFRGISGSAKENMARWKKQFLPPKGKKIDDVAKETKIKIGGRQCILLDVSGTYMYNPAPFNPKSKVEQRPNYRLLAVQFDGPENVYHIKLTGPAKTIEQHSKAYETWLKNFKK